MHLSSFLKKKNYQIIWYKLKFYPRSVCKRHSKYNTIDSIDVLIKELNLKDFEKVVVVASGPSANDLIKNENCLYLTTNRAIDLMTNEDSYIYCVHDYYYTLKYLKTFNHSKNWKGTLFWYFASKNIKSYHIHKILVKYLSNYKREKKEYLFCNIEHPVISNQLFLEINRFLNEKINFSFYGVNSGFVVTVLAFVLAFHAKKNLEIYGLDMGEKEKGYFNKSAKLGHSITGDFSKNIVNDFFLSLNKQSIITIINKSYYKPNTYGKTF